MDRSAIPVSSVLASRSAMNSRARSTPGVPVSRSDQSAESSSASETVQGCMLSRPVSRWNAIGSYPVTVIVCAVGTSRTTAAVSGDGSCGGDSANVALSGGGMQDWQVVSSQVTARLAAVDEGTAVAFAALT